MLNEIVLVFLNPLISGQKSKVKFKLMSSNFHSRNFKTFINSSLFQFSALSKSKTYLKTNQTKYIYIFKHYNWRLFFVLFVLHEISHQKNRAFSVLLDAFNEITLDFIT